MTEQLRPTANTAVTPEKLTVGDHVFHPDHGVAKVAAIEGRVVGEQQMEFYVLELAAGGRLLQPTDKLPDSGIRSLVTAAQARTLLAEVTTEPKLDEDNLRDRTDRYGEALRTGNAEAYAQVLRQLLFRSRGAGLKAAEQRLMAQARGYFVREIGTVLDKTPAQLDELLQAALHAPAGNGAAPA